MSLVRRLRAIGWLAACLWLAAVGGAAADDCGSESDCKAPPGNINRATGVASGAAGAAILIRTLGRRGS